MVVMSYDRIKNRLFSVCDLLVSGCIFFTFDLLCNDTSSVTGGGGHNVLGGTNGKDPKNFDEIKKPKEGK